SRRRQSSQRRAVSGAELFILYRLWPAASHADFEQYLFEAIQVRHAGRIQVLPCDGWSEKFRRRFREAIRFSPQVLGPDDAASKLRSVLERAQHFSEFEKYS